MHCTAKLSLACSVMILRLCGWGTAVIMTITIMEYDGWCKNTVVYGKWSTKQWTEQWTLQSNSKCLLCYGFKFCFSSVLWHCCLGDRKGICPVKKVGCWYVDANDLTGVLHIIWPHAGSGVVRIDPLRFLAGCRARATKPGLALFYILACFNCIVAY